jgi:hypothetical protein
MKEFRIEIVRRLNGRYAWLFVRRAGDKRRVLGRSARDYRSLEGVMKAVERLQGAVIDVGDSGQEPFALPETSFRLVSGVVPLVVPESAAAGEEQPQAAQRRAALQLAQPTARPMPKGKRVAERAEPAAEAPAVPVDQQQQRADVEAARAAVAADEAVAAAAAAETPTAVAAAAEAEEQAAEARAAAEAAAQKPERQRARQARAAEEAADQAEQAAEEAGSEAEKAKAKPKRASGRRPAGSSGRGRSAT